MARPLAQVTCALGPDAAGTVLTALLARAAGPVHVAAYEVSVYYAWTLVRAHRSGARVRVLLDDHAGANDGTASVLHDARVPCRVVGRGPGRETHWKLLVLGRDALALGTGNLIRRDLPRDPDGAVPPAPTAGLPGTREWWLAVAGAPGAAAAARAAIATAWREGRPASPRPALPAAMAPPVGTPHPLVGPLTVAVPRSRLHLAAGEGGAVRALLEPRLVAAGQRILVTVPYVHPGAAPVRALLARLAAAAARGVDVRLLLGSATQPAPSMPRGVAVRVMDPARSTTGHAKGVVVDGAAVVTSANWSAAGLGTNREAALAVDDPAVAGYFAAAFERDWEVSAVP